MSVSASDWHSRRGECRDARVMTGAGRERNLRRLSSSTLRPDTETPTKSARRNATLSCSRSFTETRHSPWMISTLSGRLDQTRDSQRSPSAAVTLAGRPSRSTGYGLRSNRRLIDSRSAAHRKVDSRGPISPADSEIVDVLEKLALRGLDLLLRQPGMRWCVQGSLTRRSLRAP